MKGLQICTLENHVVHGYSRPFLDPLDFYREFFFCGAYSFRAYLVVRQRNVLIDNTREDNSLKGLVRT